MMNCPKCNEPFKAATSTSVTLVGFFSPLGHNHDDNCRSRSFVCKNGHVTRMSRRNSCSDPKCDWKGKLTCFCHEGEKVDEWPQFDEVVNDEKFLQMVERGENET